MPIDILTFGEALVEVMRTEVDQPLDKPALFTGPYPSGAPFIFAIQAARLGVPTAAIGAIGRDAFGKCLTDQLEADDIDTRGVKIMDGYATGVAFVGYNGDGSRDFVFHIAQAAAGQLSPDMLDESLFDGLKVLHLMGSTLSIHDAALKTGLRALELAKRAGAKFSFDPNLRAELLSPEKARIAFLPFIEAADVIIPTAEETRLLTDNPTTEEAISALLEGQPERIIVMTQGEKGCTVYTQRQTFTIDGFHVDEIDPTGAGDCFDAGFLSRWIAGDTLEDAARFANACGALAVTVQGPATGARKLDEVRTFMEKHNI